MRGFHNSSFDPQTLVVLEAAFNEAWLTLKLTGNKTVKPDELARAVLRLAMEGERDGAHVISGHIDGVVQPERELRRRCQSVGSAVRAGNLYSKPDDRSKGPREFAVRGPIPGEQHNRICRAATLTPFRARSAR
jgi:hypothetical protein